MKIVFTLLLVVAGFNLSAQWNNTTNQFYDSLHTPVCTASGDQLNTIVLKSYPDSGYFLIWDTDGINFRNVYNVPASNSNLYSCTVPSTPDALNYYRVQQTDIDGKSTFSKVVVLNSTVATSVSVYPNPAVDKLRLTGPDNYREFTILNTEGKLLIRGKLAEQSRTLDVQQLPPGNYILKLFRNTEIQTLKFIKR